MDAVQFHCSFGESPLHWKQVKSPHTTSTFSLVDRELVLTVHFSAVYTFFPVSPSRLLCTPCHFCSLPILSTPPLHRHLCQSCPPPSSLTFTPPTPTVVCCSLPATFVSHLKWRGNASLWAHKWPIPRAAWDWCLWSSCADLLPAPTGEREITPCSAGEDEKQTDKMKQRERK